MCEAVRVRTRYETPGPKGETRRERNERFSQESPPFDVPEDGQYIWDWFYDIIETGDRIIQGEPIPFSHIELKAWSENMRELVEPSEFKILIDMSNTWCDAMFDELENAREVLKKEAEAKAKTK